MLRLPESSSPSLTVPDCCPLCQEEEVPLPATAGSRRVSHHGDTEKEWLELRGRLIGTGAGGVGGGGEGKWGYELRKKTA